MTESNELDYKQLSNVVIDELIDSRGLRYTISFLLMRGYLVNALVIIGFDKEYVEQIELDLKAEGFI
jgi:hypothetical protein